MTVIINGLSTYYEKSGSGPIVLLLHGWGVTHESLDNLKSFLTTSYTVVTLDLPGFGKTQTADIDYNLQLYAEFVRDFLSKLGLEQIYAVIGHSNGGAIAIKALSEDLIAVSKLILLASSGVRNTYTPTAKVLRIVAKLAKIPAQMLPLRWQKKLKKKAYKTIGSELFVAEDMQGTFKNIVSEDLRNQIQNISTPTLLIYGRQDKATPISFGQSFAEILQNARLEVLDGGHFIHHDAESEVRSLISEFFIDD